MVQLITVYADDRVFKTTRITLEKSSYFRSILKDETTEITIDRSGEIFEQILRLMRNPLYNFPKEYLDELVFYGVKIVPKQEVIEKKNYIVSSDGTNDIMMYDLDGTIIKKFCDNTCVRTIAISLNDEMMISGGTNLVLRDIKSANVLHRFEGHNKTIMTVAFSPDNKLVASGCQGNIIKVWDVMTGSLIYTFVGHKDWIRSLAFSPSDQILVSCSDDCTIKIWNLVSGTLENTLKGHTNWIRSLAFSPDAKMIVSGGNDNTIRIWNIKTAQNIHNFAQDKNIWSVIFSNDGTKIAIGGEDHIINIYDAKTYQLLNKLYGCIETITSINFSKDDSLLISKGIRGDIKLWDTKTNLCVKTFTSNHCIGAIAFTLQ